MKKTQTSSSIGKIVVSQIKQKEYCVRYLFFLRKKREKYTTNKKVNTNFFYAIPKQGNISIIVLFVLTIASLIALFVFQQTQVMLEALGQITTYYKSQALAKAGLELGLVLANTTTVGFEQREVGSGNTIVQQNFFCAKNNFGCNFSVDIVNRTHSFLTNNPFNTHECTSDSVFTLKEGESLVIPLFVDQRKIQNMQDSSMGLFSYDHSGYNILAAFPKKQTQEDGIFFYPFRQTTLNDEVFDIMLSFATTLESNDDEIVRQKFVQVLTGVSYVDAKTHQIINDFLYSETGSYYKKEKIGTDYIQTLNIPSKVVVFGSDENIRNFLILSYPTHCPPNALNSGDLLQIKDKKPKNGEYVPFYTTNQSIYQEDARVVKKRTNCKCPPSLYYNEQKNMCLQKASNALGILSEDKNTSLSFQNDEGIQNQKEYTQNYTYKQESQYNSFSSRYLQFCLYIKGKELSLLGIPTQYVRISSFGTYGMGAEKTQTSFEALQRVDFPDWLFNTVIER